MLQKMKETEYFEHCRDFMPKRTSWGKEIPFEKIIAHQKSIISHSMTDLPKNLEKLAIQCHKCLLSYTGERKSKKPELDHSHKLITMGLDAPSELRDEMYFQMFKQINQNPNKDSTLRVWRILAILSSLFIPSELNYHAILNFLYNQANTDDEDFRQYSKFCLKRIVKGYDDGLRRYAPTNDEIKYIEVFFCVIFRIRNI